MSDTEHGYQQDCPHCGHRETATIDANVRDHGAMSTVAIVECQSCGQLWGEERDFCGGVGRMGDGAVSGTERTSPKRLTKDELQQEVIEIADLPEKANTGQYPLRWEHLVELVRYLRTESDRSGGGAGGE